MKKLMKKTPRDMFFILVLCGAFVWLTFSEDWLQALIMFALFILIMGLKGEIDNLKQGLYLVSENRVVRKSASNVVPFDSAVKTQEKPNE